MSSEQNEGTSYQPSEPKLCANNCGFFGNAATMNLCSKCYRDYHMKEEHAASAKAAMEKSLNPQPQPQPQPNQPPQSGFSTGSFKPVGPSSSSSTTSLTFGATAAAAAAATVGVQEQEEQAQPPKVSNRCFSCNKKVGLTGFRCKCGSTFCGTHRYAEKHDCTFDFKGAGRNAIAKANPVVKADKLVERS